MHHLQKQAHVATNRLHLFASQRCRISSQFLQTLSELDLHNMRDFDERMEMIVARTIKGLSEEVGLLIDRESLTCYCPSRRILARGDTRLAADCLISVVSDIKHDGVK